VNWPGAHSPHDPIARAREAAHLVDAQSVAEYLAVERNWVYEHATLLRARRLGTGPKARLRFSLEDIDAALTCSAGRESGTAATPVSESVSRRRRTRALGTDVDLLPIRGQFAPPGRAA
jgi:hypothetical protein